MILKEGEAVPFGYGFVRHRWDYLGTEVAPMPLNWIIRAVTWLQQKSYRQMTRDEVRQLDKVKALMIEAEAKGKERGYREGSEAAWTAVTKIYMDGAHAVDPGSEEPKSGEHITSQSASPVTPNERKAE